MKHACSICLMVLFFSASLFAQPPAAFLADPVTGNGPLSATINMTGYPAPPTNMFADLDWVAAVDADDANDILGFQAAGTNSENDFLTSIFLDPPSGPSNMVHFILFDQSEGTFHILKDAAGEFIEAEYTDVFTASGDPGNDLFIDGFSGAGNTFPGVGVPLEPGVTDLNSIIDILPVELTTFTGQRTGKVVQLNWSTASEDGNEGFDIERSADGRTFTSIGYQNGMGTTRTSSEYSFIDEAPITGGNYYRLRQNDVSGSFSYSEVVFVDFVDGIVSSIRVAPNPATDIVRVNLAGTWNEMVSVQLIDQNGKQVANWTQQNSSTLRMEVSTLPAGIYQIWVQDGTHQETQRIVVR